MSVRIAMPHGVASPAPCGVRLTPGQHRLLCAVASEEQRSGACFLSARALSRAARVSQERAYYNRSKLLEMRLIEGGYAFGFRLTSAGRAVLEEGERPME